MKSLRENPVYQSSMRKLPVIEKKWLSPPGIIYLGLMIAVPSLLLRLMKVCSCTVFALAGIVTILLSVLLIGGYTFYSISGEREKKTLDSLRVTTLSAEDIIAGKVLPEFYALCRLLLALAPTVFFLGLTSEYGLPGALAVLFIAALSGILSLLGGLILSCICKSTSQAIVVGWTLKLLWLIGAPLLDMILAAVFVSRSPPPVFSSLSPMVALYALLLPEAMRGAWAILPWSFFIATPLMLFLFWQLALRIFARGEFSSIYSQRKAQEVLSHGWKPARRLISLFPGLKPWLENPAFLREISMQLRSGAGRLPGYLVFIALFIAPYLYARCWGISEYTHAQQHRPPVNTISVSSASLPSRGDTGSRTSVIRTPGGYFFALEGHTLKSCLRLTMYRTAGIPLPKERLQEVRLCSTKAPYRQAYDSHPSSRKSALVQEKNRKGLIRPITTNQIKHVNSAAIRWGLVGAIWLLLIYLAIRGCCFTIATVTGEGDRRTWEDLALAGLTPAKVLGGKILGALAYPLFQMTAVFPMLFFFVLSGNLTMLDIASLYLYGLLITITSGILGLWASATSPSTHEAQGKALGIIFLTFLALPICLPFLRLLSLIALPFYILAIIIMHRKLSPSLLAWGGISFSCAISAVSASPLLAPLSFLPSISGAYLQSSYWGCLMGSTGLPLLNLAASLVLLMALSVLLWHKALQVITEPGSQEVLRAELPFVKLRKPEGAATRV